MKDRMKKMGGKKTKVMKGGKKTGVAKRNMGKKTLSGPEVGMTGNLGGPSGMNLYKKRKDRKQKVGQGRSSSTITSNPGGGSSPGAYEGNRDGNGMARGKKTEMRIENFKDMMYKKFGGKT